MPKPVMSDVKENFSGGTNGEQNESRILQAVENCEEEINASTEAEQNFEDMNYGNNGQLKTEEDRMSLATYQVQEDDFRGRVQKFIDNIDSRVASNQLVLAQDTQSQMLANIQYLRYLQFGFCYLEARFYKEMYALECKYERLLEPLFTMRKQIVEGSLEPEDTDLEDEQVDDDSSATVGIPLFWLSVFKNSPILSSIIAERDEAVLSHLVDVRMSMHESEPAGFTLEFQFSPNDFFSNDVLVKSYYLNCMPDASNPLSFNGPEAYRSTGCTIFWNQGMDVTTRLVKKVVRRPNGRVGTITQIVRCSSFFNLFSSNANDSLHYDEVTIGNHIRAVVPRAFLFFVGDIWQTDDPTPENELVPEIEECAMALNNLSL